MTREFIIVSEFDKQWEKLGLTDNDLYEFQDFIMVNPSAGDLITGAGGLRKIRWALPNAGKSGGARVLYIDYISFEKTVLVSCYGKAEKINITNKEKAIYKEFSKTIEKELRG
jgi:hypothetical protein